MHDVLAIEAIIALQAVEYKDVEKLSPKTYEKYQSLRKVVPSITEDRQFHKDIEAVSQYLLDHAYAN